MKIIITIEATGLNQTAMHQIRHDLEAQIKDAANDVVSYLGVDAEIKINNRIK